MGSENKSPRNEGTFIEENKIVIARLAELLKYHRPYYNRHYIRMIRYYGYK